MVMKDRITGKPRGFAYVTYSTAEEAQTAINAGDANILDGKWVVVMNSELSTQSNSHHTQL